MDNKSKIDRLHDLLPQYLNTRHNTNWKGLIEAVGEADQDAANLIEEVRKQFFVRTSSRPYIDRLAANNKISRPRLVGMSDASFRDYIPVLSYKPKQVKLIIDSLLDIFFFKDSTTAFIMSQNSQPFTLADGWELEYQVDGINNERVVFNASDFTNITAATADEIVASINRQSKYSYGTNYFDSVTKKSFIRIFTKTVGSKGSLEILGGRANTALRLNGFLDNAGNGSNTQWTVTKVGDLTTFQHTGGALPGLNILQEGDILISSLPGNQGSFAITSIDISTNSISFKNLFATPGVFTQVSSDETKFVRPQKFVCYKSPRRAVTWETKRGEFVVEIPTTPPVVQRSLKGSTHINGTFSLMTNRDSDTSLTITNGAGFPRSGSFMIESVNAITTRIITPETDEVVVSNSNGRLIYDVPIYHYDSRIVLSTSGNSTTGSNQITVNSVAGLANGMTIFMDGLREDAIITDILGLTITSSVASTQTLLGAVVEFGGNTLTGITPNVPSLSALNQQTLTSLSRTSNVATFTTATTHNYLVGDTVIIFGSSGINALTTTGDTAALSNMITNLASTLNVAPGQLVFGPGIPSDTKVVGIISPTQVQIDKNATSNNTAATILFNENTNGSFEIASVTSNQFTALILGVDGSATTPGMSRVERIALSNSDSKIILTSAQSADDTRIKGSYLWDTAAPFVLSSSTASTEEEIQAGKIIRLITVDANNTIPDQSGFVIFDYGRNNQEGPIRYLYKPAANVLALDPSYVFQKTHVIGAPVVVISHKGPHIMSSRADEFGPYITDPSEARIILEDLIRSVKSAGIFVNFLIRFPEQLYGTLDVYNSELG